MDFAKIGKAALVATITFLFGAWASARAAIPAPADVKTAPPPAKMRAEVVVSGRTSTLVALDIARLPEDAAPPRTFSPDGLLRSSEGFRWYVSRHFAVKTDLQADEASEALSLLELAWPHYASLFGQTPPGCEELRLALVLASSRNALYRAMLDDDMHVLHLGGITQEGYACSYLYAGAPYQTRYIVLHEATHLFQYAISGDTRNCHGFFVEGVADLLSSHVYDPAAQRLTVNVLDRAPIHNHLLNGLAEWRKDGCPAFSRLFAATELSRGLSVLLTAFLQHTPEWEQKWRIFASEIIKTPPRKSPRDSAEALLRTLYGPPGSLDAEFLSWMESLSPSYELRGRDFDQIGSSFVALAPASAETPAQLLLPSASSVRSSFVRDWPLSAQASRPPADGQARPLFSARFRWSTLPPGEAASASLSFVPSPTNAAVARCTLTETRGGGFTLAVTNEKGQESPPLLFQGISLANGFEIEVAELPDHRALHFAVRAGGLRKAVECPLTSIRWQARRNLRPLLSATAPGLVVTPIESPPPTNVPPSAAPGCRFAPSADIARIYRAAWELGTNAPQALLIVRNDLVAHLADDGGGGLVSPEDLASPDFWKQLADAIAASPAPEARRHAALAALADVRLDLAPAESGDRFNASLLQSSTPSIDSATFVWRRNGLTLRTTTPERRKEAPAPFADMARIPGDEAAVASVEASARWLGHEIRLSCSRPVRMGIPLWHVLGPVALRGEDETFDMTAAPTGDGGGPYGEISVSPADGTLLRWKKEACLGGEGGRPALLPLNRIFHMQADRCAALAGVDIISPRDQDVALELGVTDGVEVLCNGESVLRDLTHREWAEGTRRILLHLRKGRNFLCLRLFHSGGVWFLSGRISAPDGTPAQGLRYE